MKGMMPQEQWRSTQAARHSTYSCAKCGRGLKTPSAVYRHLDAKHPAKGGRG